MRNGRLDGTDILEFCADYFWHYPSSPGFDSVIACNNRSVELNPQLIELYTANAWLLWSDWVSWKLDPESMPDKQDNVDEALRMLRQGHDANPSSAAYHLDAAQTIVPLAYHHRPDLFDVVTRYYLYAEELASDENMRIRIRKQLGHSYRKQELNREAIRWYRAVLELEPDNKVALRYLKMLGAKP